VYDIKRIVWYNARHIARSSNGRTAGFGPVNLGSSPSLATRSEAESFQTRTRTRRGSGNLLVPCGESSRNRGFRECRKDERIPRIFSSSEYS
jgi:hypothetical protein